MQGGGNSKCRGSEVGMNLACGWSGRSWVSEGESGGRQTWRRQQGQATQGNGVPGKESELLSECNGGAIGGRGRSCLI